MKRILVILLALPTAGCLPEQKRQLASCEIEAIKFVPTERARDDFIVTCMVAHGYEWRLANTKCKATSLTIFRDLHCYRPDDFVGQVSYDLEARFSN